MIEKTSSPNVNHLTEQVAYDTPEEVKEFLANFYNMDESDFRYLYKHRDIDESFFITHDNEQAKLMVKQWVGCSH